MPTNPGSWLPLLHELADRADAIAKRHFRSPDLGVDTKPDASPVTRADRAIEETVRAVIERRHPDLGILGEEGGETRTGAPLRLILDPIDGTRNFIRGIPVFATLLAVEHAGEVVAGLASAPALGLRWHAARGNGAFCGERRLAVSRVAALARAQLFHGSIGGHDEHSIAALLTLAAQVERTRGFGDFYQHLLVAEGAGEIAVDPAVKPWDIAALQIIVEEAGGRCTTLGGERSIYGGSLLTTNGVLHRDALRVLVRSAEG